MTKAVFNSGSLAILFVFGFATAGRVQAQFTSEQWTDSVGAPFNNPLSAFASNLIWQHINEQVMANATMGSPGGASLPHAGSGSQSNTGGSPISGSEIDARINRPVRFRPTGTRLMLKTLSEKFSGNANQQARTMQLLSTLMQSYETKAAGKGYPNDLALALSSFIAFNCAAYQQKTIASDDKILALRQLIGVLAVQQGVFAALNDLQRQETYETLIMTGGLTGTVIEIAGTYYKPNGPNEIGRYTYTDQGTTLRVANTGGNALIGWEVYCFFKDNRQLAALGPRQKVVFEATVQGRQEGSANLILVDAVLR